MIRESNIPKKRAARKRGPKKTARLNAPQEQFDSLARDVARNLRLPIESLIVAERFLGKTYNTSATAAYTDHRYEVQRFRHKWDLKQNDKADFELDQFPYKQQQIVVASNIVESAFSTHLIPDNTVVEVVGVVVRKNPRVIHYYFSCPLPYLGSAIIVISANAAGGGKYTGTIGTPPSTAVSAGNLAMTEGMGSGDSALILNLSENGAATHNLASGKYHPGVIVGRQALGTWIVMIDVGSGSCSPGVDTFQCVTDTDYSSPNFTETKTTFTVDFCAGTITPGSVISNTVFTTAACDTPPTTSGEFYSY